MMPDMTQQGKAEVKEWKPDSKVPVILFDRVTKTYGKIKFSQTMVF